MKGQKALDTTDLKENLKSLQAAVKVVRNVVNLGFADSMTEHFRTQFKALQIVFQATEVFKNDEVNMFFEQDPEFEKPNLISMKSEAINLETIQIKFARIIRKIATQKATREGGHALDYLREFLGEHIRTASETPESTLDIKKKDIENSLLLQNDNIMMHDVDAKAWNTGAIVKGSSLSDAQRNTIMNNNPSGKEMKLPK